MTLGVALVRADSREKQEPHPYARLSPAEQQRLVDDARARVASPQWDYLAEYNAGQRDANALPIGEIESFTFGSPVLPESAAAADDIVVARAEALFFFGSGMEDLPATRVTYVVLEVVKGPMKSGQRFTLDLIGGPYRQPNGEDWFVQPANVRIDRPGQDAVLFLTGEGAARSVTSSGGHFQLSQGKIVADPYNEESRRREGQSTRDFVREVRRLAAP